MENSYKVLTGIRHEIRSEMTTIVGLSYLLEGSTSRVENDINYSNEILYACNKVLNLFENYLDSSLMDLINPRIVLKRCRLNSIIDQVVPQFTEVLERKKKNGLILFNENNLYDSTEVYLDSAKVKRAIQHLFQNAINNVSEGYIKIGYVLSKDKLTFYILDTGEEFNKSREYFYTADMEKSLLKFSDINSAINITLAKKIVKLLGGTITIENHEGRGTGFHIAFSVRVSEKSICYTKAYERTESDKPEFGYTG